MINEATTVVLADPEFAEELYRLTDRNRSYLSEWLPWLHSVTCPADTEKYIQGELRKFAKGEAYYACIISNQSIAGVIGFKNIDVVNGIAQMGYWLGEEYCGKGLMTACAMEFLEIGRSTLHLKKVEICCAVGNRKSRAIPKRLGFAQKEIRIRAENVNGVWHDHIVYRLKLEQAELETAL